VHGGGDSVGSTGGNETFGAQQPSGAEFRRLDRGELAGHLPFVEVPWETGIFDPLGGSLRIRRALTALAQRADIRRADVLSVADDGSVALVDGTQFRADRVLICAGVQTPALFGPLDIEFGPHTRFTYEGANATGAACLSAPEGYGLPIGSTGRWAFGQDVADPVTVRRLFPTLTPVGQVDCVTARASWLDAGGDGWTLRRRGRVSGFVGANLMKFGPVLGDLLADFVLDTG
ncbi:FAD-dependent oxidoreductase, partial [Mycobacterium asiaticum]|uniref:FAD-dependent oxidoreductase n=1 Tax=Mycobacterium asiaticum TaxID=1790 RepID=UPI0015602A4B